MKYRISILFLVFSIFSWGNVTLPKLISDGMILQRNTEIKLWGWADPSEEILINFMNQTFTCQANADGEWSVQIPPQPAGGPYTLDISGKNNIQVSNILFGDVWLCSGQSNMELSMYRVRMVSNDEIENANNDLIRCFTVPQEYDFKSPRYDLSGGEWISTTAETVLKFSAVAYFFAKDLFDQYNVPIGIINASLGGSPIEAWMSEEALQKFPEHLAEAVKFRDDNLIKEIESSYNKEIENWQATLTQKDRAYNDSNDWKSTDLDTSDWDKMNIPGYWKDTPLGLMNGSVWFRKEIELPEKHAGKKAFMNMGRIVDADSVFINQQFVGNTTYQYPPRWYDIQENVLQAGKNIITVRVVSDAGAGGFVLDKPYNLLIGNDTIDLQGEWQYKLGASSPPAPAQTFVRWKPTGLFNAMIVPLNNYSIKGTIWYQGESNAGKPMEYRSLFPSMIQDWRKHFNQSDFPFLFVQLTNFMESYTIPTESNWALLRESQTKTLSLPNTGMATTIDIGEWNDIHPVNKKDVGKRLALAARKVAYGENIVSTGPTFKSMKIKGNKIELSFDNIGSGLASQGDEILREFAVAGADKTFVWANAKIKKDKIIIWSSSVKKPKSARYAWADNPEGANLYNKEGLPAVPFRTDNW